MARRGGRRRPCRTAGALAGADTGAAYGRGTRPEDGTADTATARPAGTRGGYPDPAAVLDRVGRLLASTDVPAGLSAHWRAGWRTHVAMIRAAHAGADPRVVFDGDDGRLQVAGLPVARVPQETDGGGFGFDLVLHAPAGGVTPDGRRRDWVRFVPGDRFEMSWLADDEVVAARPPDGFDVYRLVPDDAAVEAAPSGR